MATQLMSSASLGEEKVNSFSGGVNGKVMPPFGSIGFNGMTYGMCCVVDVVFGVLINLSLNQIV